MSEMEKIEEAIKVAQSATKIIEENLREVIETKKKERPIPGWMCPKCGSENISVVDSRRRPDYIFRARICLNCGNKYQTMEIVMEKEQ